MLRFPWAAPRLRVVGLVAVMLLSACSAAPVETPDATPELTSSAVPADGTTLNDLGFVNAPAGLSIPNGALISDRVDSPNNITVVMTSPDGLTVVEFLRRHLPELGFTISGDDQNSLIFEGGGYQGAFTTSAGYSALTLRTDR